MEIFYAVPCNLSVFNFIAYIFGQYTPVRFFELMKRVEPASGIVDERVEVARVVKLEAMEIDTTLSLAAIVAFHCPVA